LAKIAITLPKLEIKNVNRVMKRDTETIWSNEKDVDQSRQFIWQRLSIDQMACSWEGKSTVKIVLVIIKRVVSGRNLIKICKIL
jgi:hypothetical protein